MPTPCTKQVGKLYKYKQYIHTVNNEQHSAHDDGIQLQRLPAGRDGMSMGFGFNRLARFGFRILLACMVMIGDMYCRRR
ncbi:hypothetical protein D3C76_1711560 [compost metagenome]